MGYIVVRTALAPIAMNTMVCVLNLSGRTRVRM